MFQIESTSLASVIELYHFKLSEMKHAENALKRNLEAADWSRGQLTRRVSQLDTETNRLHQLLLSGQLALESAKSELDNVREQRVTAEEAAKNVHIKLKQVRPTIPQALFNTSALNFYEMLKYC